MKTPHVNRTPLKPVVLGLSLGLTLGLAGSALAANGSTTELPFNLPLLDDLNTNLNTKHRLVFTHYFTPFRQQMENTYPDTTWTGYLHPTSGQYFPTGGRVREIPLQRAPMPYGLTLPYATYNGTTIANWEFEDDMHQVRQAEVAGLDGWTLYYGGSTGEIYPNDLVMMDAVTAASDHFKVALNPDMSTGHNWTNADFEGTIIQLGSYPSAYHLPEPDGRLLVTPYQAETQTPAWYKYRFDAVQTAIPSTLMPMFLDYTNFPTFANDITLKNSGYLYGASTWGGATPGQSDANMIAAHTSNPPLVFMNSARPDSVRPKPDAFWYQEGKNTQAYRDQWKNSVTGDSNKGAEMIQIATWSDFGEGTELMPSTAKTYAYLDLATYYITWYKTGALPTIARDAFYGIYRTQSTGVTPDATVQSMGAMPIKSSGGGQAGYNKIEMLAFVKQIQSNQTVTLQMVIDGQTQTATLTPTSVGVNNESLSGAAGGLYSFSVNLPAGLGNSPQHPAQPPVFTLTRMTNGVNTTVITQSGYWDVSDNLTGKPDNLLYHSFSSLRSKPEDINKYALSAAYRWTNPNAVTNPDSAHYSAAYGDVNNVKLRLREVRSTFTTSRLTNDQAARFIDNSTSQGAYGGMGYSFNKTDDNGVASNYVSFDFIVLDAGGSMLPIFKLSNASTTTSTINDGIVLSLFADNGAGGHVLKYQNSAGNFVAFTNAPALSTSVWYRVAISFNTGTDKYDLKLTAINDGGSQWLWSNTDFSTGLNATNQVTFYNYSGNIRHQR